MYTLKLVAVLWEYTGLCQDSVRLTATSSDLELIEQYVASPSFITTFLPGETHKPIGIHGPFIADRIHAEDFVAIEESDVEPNVEGLWSWQELGKLAQRAKVRLLPHLCDAFAGGRRCYMLKRDERDKDLFHDWGFVFTIFREFLFVNPDRIRLDRFLIIQD